MLALWRFIQASVGKLYSLPWPPPFRALMGLAALWPGHGVVTAISSMSGGPQAQTDSGHGGPWRWASPRNGLDHSAIDGCHLPE